MKKILFALTAIALALAVSAAAYAEEASITITNNTVTVNNAPKNSTLITAFYKNKILSDVKLYKGSGTITADISEGVENSDMAKMFLWDMETIRPLSESAKLIKADKISVTVNGRALTATLTDNSSSKAFLELLKKSPVTIEMHDYGNFEKVGPLGATLPRNDEQITTQAGDLILYQGNQLTIYYDTNSWSFTRLGRIDNITQNELKEILGDGNVTVTFSVPDTQTENDNDRY